MIARIILLLAALTPTLAHATTVYDLAADWSDTTNPNGAWSYNDEFGNPIATHQADWDTGNLNFAAIQPAWAAQQASAYGHIPMWAKSTGATVGSVLNLDFPLGRVGMHGPEDQPKNLAAASVSWTSPASGDVDISGGVWLMRKVGRSMDWTLSLNGSPFTSGQVNSLDAFTSANPFGLEIGSGGASSLQFSVAPGDVISLSLGRSTVEIANEFVGVDFAISLSPVPEPSTVILAAVGLIGLAAYGWRRRKR